MAFGIISFFRNLLIRTIFFPLIFLSSFLRIFLNVDLNKYISDLIFSIIKRTREFFSIKNWILRIFSLFKYYIF